MPLRPDSLTAGIEDLDRELIALQWTYRTTSPQVGEQGVEPERITADGLSWWRHAWSIRLRRLYER